MLANHRAGPSLRTGEVLTLAVPVVDLVLPVTVIFPKISHRGKSFS
jgi:hypothetical protein